MRMSLWDRVRNLINIKCDSEPVYCDNGKYIKTKIKSYGDNVNANFAGNEAPKKSATYKRFSMIILDSVIRVNKVLSSNTFRKV